MAACALARPALAEEELGWKKGDIVVSAGVATVMVSTSADITLAGNPVPGGGAKLSTSTVPSGSIEYFLSSNVSFAMSAGLPPKTRVTGTGTLARLGEIGQVRYGLSSLVARYHFNGSGRLSPYLAAGVSRFMVFSTKDGSVTDLDTTSAWAPVMRAGLDYHLTRHVGLFATATYIPIKSNATGFTNGQPITAHSTLKSTTLKAGIGYRF